MDFFLSSFCSFASTIILIISITTFSTSLGHLSKEFKACRQTFSCGDITNISYPFFGQNRPAYCGHPGFELQNCDQSSEPIKIKILSQRFIALDINSSSSTITVAREDYYTRSGCPTSLDNITIDFSIFEYSPGYENITLLYDDCASKCSSLSPKAMTYSCPVSPVETLHVCVLTKKMVFKSNFSGLTCPNHLFLPVHKSKIVEVDKSRAIVDVKKGALHGFELKWIVNDAVCRECVGSGGQCGHNWLSNEFFCFCPDDLKCNFPGSTSHKFTLTKPKIAILASFSAMGIGLLIIVAFYFKKKYSSHNQVIEVSLEIKNPLNQKDAHAQI